MTFFIPDLIFPVLDVVSIANILAILKTSVICRVFAQFVHRVLLMVLVVPLQFAVQTVVVLILLLLRTVLNINLKPMFWPCEMLRRLVFRKPVAGSVFDSLTLMLLLLMLFEVPTLPFAESTLIG
jgi:hypothetical protein